jgi:hypothetical protein
VRFFLLSFSVFQKKNVFCWIQDLNRTIFLCFASSSFGAVLRRALPEGKKACVAEMGKKRKADAPVAVVKKKVKRGRTAGSKDKPSRTSYGKTDNVFETLWTRRKFDVLGKKQKGESRRVGLSRSTSVDKVCFSRIFIFLPKKITSLH